MKCLYHLLLGITLTGALFVSQACSRCGRWDYVDPLYEYGKAQLSFSVVSRDTGTPLSGIRILGRQTDEWKDWSILAITGEDGQATLSIPYVRNTKGPFVRFEDPFGAMATKDTVFYDLRPRKIIIKMTQ